MNRKELTEAMVRIKPLQGPKKTKETVRYNIFGESDANIPNKFTDEQTAAIELQATSGTSYRIKAERGGNLFNPLKQNNSYSLSSQDRTTKDLRFQFRTVAEKAFRHYVQYLSTKHDSLLVAAQREI